MKHVLIIEGDPDTLDILKYLLSDFHYNVSGFSELITLQEIIAIDPDYIILDDRLSNGLGTDLCRELKTGSATKHIPVVLMSTHPRLEQFAKGCLASSSLENHSISTK